MPKDRPLAGVRIVEIEGIGPGPFAAMMLADLGADVVVVHRPRSGPVIGLMDRPVIDRGKRSLVLDLKSDADWDVVLKLLVHADGLIEGFRPGVMERLGLGPDICHAVNPRLVYGRMTGWGQDGPLAERAGHDLNYIAMAGALWSSGLDDERPAVPPTLVGDIGGGALYLVAGMLSGIIAAGRTGQGTVVDAAIYDGAAHMQNLLMSIAGRRTDHPHSPIRWLGHIGRGPIAVQMAGSSACNALSRNSMQSFLVSLVFRKTWTSLKISSTKTHGPVWQTDWH